MTTLSEVRTIEHVQFGRQYDPQGRTRWVNAKLCDPHDTVADVSENPDLFDFNNIYALDVLACEVCRMRLTIMRANGLKLTRFGLTALHYLLNGGDTGMLELMKIGDMIGPLKDFKP